MMACRPMRLAINTSSELYGGAPTRPPKSEPTVVCKVPGTSGLRANLVCLPGEGLPAVNNSRCMTALAHHSPLGPQTALLRSMPNLAWMLFWKLLGDILSAILQQAPLRVHNGTMLGRQPGKDTSRTGCVSTQLAPPTQHARLGSTGGQEQGISG